MAYLSPGAFWRRLLATSDTLTPADIDRGERLLVVDGALIFGMLTLQGGVFLTAFALRLGASNFEIGLLTTIGLGSQLMQLSGLALLRHFPKRRAITVISVTAARLLWIPIILTPLLFAGKGMSFLLLWLILASLVGSVSAPPWNSLMREIVPEDHRGKVFGRRLAWGTGIALVLTLVGGWFVDWWKTAMPESQTFSYSLLFALGLICGLGSAFVLTGLPETPMQDTRDESLISELKTPIADRNFRQVIAFVAIWSFAVNLAAPFFVVYMLERIGLSVFVVTVLAVLSQLCNIAFLAIWGRLADRFSNKSVMAVSGFLFLLAIVAWTFTTLPERHLLTMPLLVAIHLLSGMSVAGISIASGNLALKLSPGKSAHAYMTVFSLAAAIAGGLAPLVGGMIADFFSVRELTVNIAWASPHGDLAVSAISLKSLDFLFLFAFVIGLYSLQRLGRVEETGEVTERQVVEELMNEVAIPVRSLSTIVSPRRLLYLPLAAIRKRMGLF